MVRVYKRKLASRRYADYSKEKLEECLESIRNGTFTQREAEANTSNWVPAVDGPGCTFSSAGTALLFPYTFFGTLTSIFCTLSPKSTEGVLAIARIPEKTIFFNILIFAEKPKLPKTGTEKLEIPEIRNAAMPNLGLLKWLTNGIETKVREQWISSKVIVLIPFINL
nr:unnamed protein product [Callosobruchus chinensis]